MIMHLQGGFDSSSIINISLSLNELYAVDFFRNVCLLHNEED